MTEYGRGPGSEPWHPGDPLYGDPAWNADQRQSWDPYRAAQQPQQAQYPQHGGRPPYPEQQYPQQGRDPSQQAHQPGYPHPQQPHQPQQPGYGGGGWDESQGGGQPYGMGTDPYGRQQPADPYADGQHPGYYGSNRPPYPPEHPRSQEPQDGRRAPAPGRGRDDDGWDPGPDQGEHAFFAGDDGDPHDDYDDEGREPSGRAGRRERERRGKGKRKNGCACLAVAVVLAGGLGTAGYFAHDLWTTHFADAPDFSGQGSGEVQVEIPDNSTLSDMGNILKKEGVVKSHDAFVEAADGASIQAGIYTLRKGMSAAAAVKMMNDPASQSGLILAEGLRATQIYKLIDEKTGSEKGTAKKAAESADLGLPEWADGDVEGFLFPSKYSVGEKSEPEDVLKQMVKRAKTEFTKVGLEAEAKKAGRSPQDLLSIASLIQAEAQEDDEFGKVSQVIYNRLKPDNTATNGKLEFDSTINYAMGRSTLDVSVTDTKFDSPYNTYLNRGLPPGPINNPGHQAIEAALNPTEGPWLYFVTVKAGDTRFAEDIAEHNKNVKEFNAEQSKKRDD